MHYCFSMLNDRTRQGSSDLRRDVFGGGEDQAEREWRVGVLWPVPGCRGSTGLVRVN